MSRLKIGMIGLGAVAHVHANVLERHVEEAELAGVYSRTPETSEEFARRYDCESFPSARELVYSDAIDAIIVTSPQTSHELYVQMALDARKPVLCEKPLASSIEECSRLLGAELSVGERLVTVGFMRRFDPAYLSLQAVLDSGDVGVPKVIHSSHRNASPPPRYDWRHAFTEVAIHDMDIIKWILDDAIVEIIALSSIADLKQDDAEPFLMAGRTMNGTTFSIEAFVDCDYGYDIQCEIAGSKGAVRLPREDAIPVRQGFQERKAISDNYSTRFSEAFVRQLQAWCGSVNTRSFTGASLWDGLQASYVADAALHSYKSGSIAKVSYPAMPKLYEKI